MTTGPMPNRLKAGRNPHLLHVCLDQRKLTASNWLGRVVLFTLWFFLYGSPYIDAGSRLFGLWGTYRLIYTSTENKPVAFTVPY